MRFYDGDAGRWSPVPLADMSVRELARTALAIADLVTAKDSDAPLTDRAVAVIASYRRELRDRGVAAWRAL